jgi:hypothetical protein
MTIMELKTHSLISMHKTLGCQPTWFGSLSVYARAIENSDSGGSR